MVLIGAPFAKICGFCAHYRCRSREAAEVSKYFAGRRADIRRLFRRAGIESCNSRKPYIMSGVNLIPHLGFFREHRGSHSPKQEKIIRMTEALIALQKLTAQLETLSRQLKCAHDPEERQTILKRFRSVLDRTDELIARDFLPSEESAGNLDGAESSG